MSTKKSSFVLLEGVDLSGKSSVIKHLVKKHKDWRHQHYTIVGSNNILDVAREIEKDGSEWIGHLYVKALEKDLHFFKWPETNTIQDSTILLRSLAYHAAAKYTKIVHELETLALRHPKFSVSYVFTASIEVRKERLKERMQSEPKRVTANDLKVIRDPEFFLRMESAMVDYAQTLFGAMVIDTSSMTVEDVANSISLH